MTMQKTDIQYDELSDTLYLVFEGNPTGREITGIELNPHILLRVDVESGTLVGVSIFDYSIVAQRTQMGPRSFPLTGLQKLPGTLREMALRILSSPPANEFFATFAYTPTSANEAIPITSLQALPVAV